MAGISGRLNGTIALVTGAGRMRGIGRAAALRLAEDGADVAVCARQRGADDLPEHERAAGWRGAESVAEEIRKLGRRAIAVDCDVTSSAQIGAAFDRVTSELGTPNAIVNNAGVSGSAGSVPIAELDEAEWRYVLDVNLTGVFLVAKVAASRMLAAGLTGSIVNVSSIAGRIPFPNFGAYCASKFGVIGFTQQLALELADKKIRVNCVCPGATATDMVSRSYGETAKRTGESIETLLEQTGERIPLGRFSSPDEQAAVISFLVGPDSSFITGQSLNANGGVRMD